MFSFRVKTTQKDIEVLKALHKEKPFHKFADFICIAFRLHKGTVLKVMKEIPIEENLLENGYYQYSYKGVPFFQIKFGSYPYERQRLYVVEEFEQLISGRQYISERSTNQFHVTVSGKERKVFSPSFRGQTYVCSADSLDELREQFSLRFNLNPSNQKKASLVEYQ